MSITCYLHVLRYTSSQKCVVEKTIVGYCVKKSFSPTDVIKYLICFIFLSQYYVMQYTVWNVHCG